MRAFALNERVAVWIVGRWYDPWEASEAFLRLSNELHKSGGCTRGCMEGTRIRVGVP